MRKKSPELAIAEERGIYAQVRPHERLEAWKTAVDLVCDLYRVSKGFPKEETCGIVAQVRRAAVSVPANIAEGCARRSKDERRQFCYIARASLSEVETHLEISRRLGFLGAEEALALRSTCSRVAALINGMIRA